MGVYMKSWAVYLDFYANSYGKF